MVINTLFKISQVGLVLLSSFLFLNDALSYSYNYFVLWIISLLSLIIVFENYNKRYNIDNDMNMYYGAIAGLLLGFVSLIYQSSNNNTSQEITYKSSYY